MELLDAQAAIAQAQEQITTLLRDLQKKIGLPIIGITLSTVDTSTVVRRSSEIIGVSIRIEL